MTELLICGSRDISGVMSLYVERLLDRVQVLGWKIVVGDAPGVDRRVIAGAKRRGIAYRIFVPMGYTPRVDDVMVRHAGMGYLGRDREMVKVADRVIAVWNGVSRGTKYTYDYAVKLGKPADLKTFRS